MKHAQTGTHIVRTAFNLDWTRFEGAAALRCTAGVAVLLLAGLAVGQPAVSAFGAVGAVSVGFGSFQGAYRSRAAVMLWAAAGMALAIVAGSLAGYGNAAAVAVAGGFAFVAGLLVALGPAAAFVGLRSVVAVLVASGFPTGLSAPRRARGWYSLVVWRKPFSSCRCGRCVVSRRSEGRLPRSIEACPHTRARSPAAR